ncbi:hypothetical protein [Micromonospora sp. NBC_01412]|uniref:hypothetical protein n=1 Tax=Micromonospora sp. NBC_01412 TaxID=2903590 RepID=UPI003249B4A8
MAKTAASATTGTVYVLRDPRDLRVCYVGATTVPLATRLNGHLSSPASDALRAWIAELKAVGLVPMIEPLREGVPVAGLAVAETAEIHARTLRREPLLNVNGKAAARRILAEREAEKARRRELTHWRATAARIRAVAGPLPPGFDTAVILSDETWEAIQEVAAVHAAMPAHSRQNLYTRFLTLTTTCRRARGCSGSSAARSARQKVSSWTTRTTRSVSPTTGAAGRSRSESV